MEPQRRALFFFSFLLLHKSHRTATTKTAPICTARAEFVNQKGYQTFKTYTRKEREPPLATSLGAPSHKNLFPPLLLTNVQITGSKWTWTGACDKIMIVELVIEKVKTTGDVRQLLSSLQVADTHQIREAAPLKRRVCPRIPC